MAPICIAIIGLSQGAKTSWASQAHLPYLLSERGRSRYRIVALLNSSKASAEKAIETYGLSPEIKAYGSPQDLAADDNVELVVCTTRVDVHYDTVKPSVEAGKSAFVEWPLAENVERARELADLARISGSKTLVGLQGVVAPSIVKVREVLRSGAIDKVLSSDVAAYTPFGGGDSISKGLAYFLEKKVGGNPVTIASAHMMNHIHSVLGEYASSHVHLQIQRPDQQIIHDESANSTTSDVPDLVSVHGTLADSDYVQPGASLTAHFQTGPPFPGTTAFVWTITGTEGRLRITSQRGPFVGSESSAHPIPIELEDAVTGEMKDIGWGWEDWQEPLPPRARDIGKVYDLFFEGRAKDAGLADFAGAVARHAQIDAMLY